jgi:CelD/BcsL family acetyltransferase involved in cellulose biosynthesis
MMGGRALAESHDDRARDRQFGVIARSGANRDSVRIGRGVGHYAAMKPRIARTRPASSVEWDAIWRGCGYATYFHSRGWAEIWSEYSRGRVRPAPLLLEFPDQRRALLPLSRERVFRGLMTRVLSSPAGTYGGWISDTSLDDADGRLLTEWLLQRHRLLVWRQNPYAPGPVATGAGWKHEDTQMLDLSVGFDAVLREWTKGHRSAVSKAKRSGVMTRLAGDARDWLDYYAVYEDSLRRWGGAASSRYDRRLFEILQRRADSDGNIRLWLATHQDRIVAGAICLQGPASMVYWHGAALEQYFDMRPVNLLLHDAIRDADERKLAWFDFNPSGGHAGVEHFKAGFGAQAKAAAIYHANPPSLHAMRVAVAAWKHRG